MAKAFLPYCHVPSSANGKYPSRHGDVGSGLDWADNYADQVRTWLDLIPSQQKERGKDPGTKAGASETCNGRLVGASYMRLSCLLVHLSNVADVIEVHVHGRFDSTEAKRSAVR